MDSLPLLKRHSDPPPPGIYTRTCTLYYVLDVLYPDLVALRKVCTIYGPPSTSQNHFSWPFFRGISIFLKKSIFFFTKNNDCFSLCRSKINEAWERGEISQINCRDFNHGTYNRRQLRTRCARAEWLGNLICFRHPQQSSRLKHFFKTITGFTLYLRNVFWATS